MRSAALVTLGMSWSAGFVDAGCYERLERTYTSHITGSTAGTAANLATGMWTDAARFGWAVASFVIGLLLGAWLRHVEHRQHIRSAFATVLAAEIVMLTLFIWWSGFASFPLGCLLFLAAAAMGMQTVTVTRVGKIRVYTTFHTGSLSKFSEAITGYLFWAWDRTRGRFWKRLARVLRVTPRHETMQQASITAGIWLAFLIGAVCGVAAVSTWGSIALAIAMAPLGYAIRVDLRRPAQLADIASVDRE